MIRPATAADFGAIADIYNHYIVGTTVSFEESSVSRSDMATRIDKVSKFGLPWLVAEDKDAILGYA